MNWSKFNYEGLLTQTGDKIGLISELDEEKAQKHEMPIDKETKGNAVSAIPYIPMNNHLVLMIVWKIRESLFGAGKEKELRQEPPVAKIVVAKGAAIKNIQIGDIVNLSTHANMNNVSIKDNKITMFDTMERAKAKTSKIIRDSITKTNQEVRGGGASLYKELYCVDYLSVPISSVEGVYLEVDE